jgi:hypothetical protein
MSSFDVQQIMLILAPPVLILSTHRVFTTLKRQLPPHRTYLFGFVFYWVVWCILFPWAMLGVTGLSQLFVLTAQPLGEPPLIGLAVLVLPVLAAPFFTGMLRQWGSQRLAVVLVSLLFAAVNGAGEEILWRGVFVSVFPENILWAYIYPAIAFGLWHLSPQVVHPAEGGALKFAFSAIFLGLAYGWVAYSTGSILLTTISHVLLDWTGLPGLDLVKADV